MTDRAYDHRFHRYGTQADRLIDRVKAYLWRRRASDWGFFLVGVILGALLF